MKVSKKILALALSCIIILSAMLTLPICAGAAPSTTDIGNQAYQYLQYIQQNLPKRGSATAVEVTTKDWIMSKLSDAGYSSEVTVQPFTYSSTRNSQNIIVKKAGKIGKEIVIGAHYDSESRRGTGVADNGSGFSLLLATAIALKDVPTTYSLTFIFFGAEEAGLRGSSAYVASLSADQKANIELMVNMDTILCGDYMYIYGGKYNKTTGAITDTYGVEQAYKMAQGLALPIRLNPGLDAEYPTPVTGDWSDHAPFKNANIPYIYFESTNWEIAPFDGSTETAQLGTIMHTANDDLTVIEATFPGRALNTLTTYAKLLYAIATDYKPDVQISGSVAANKVIVNDSVSVAINASRLVSANVFGVSLNYDSAKLQFVDYTLPEGFITIEGKAPENGNLEIIIGSQAILNGQSPVVTVNFKAIGAGAANVQIKDTDVAGAFEDDTTYEYTAPGNTVKLTIYESTKALCDITADGNVGLADLSIAMKYYSLTSKDAAWNAMADRCDVSGDGVVDMADLIMICSFLN